MIKFTVKLPPISKKNSQQIFVNQNTGKPFIMPSAKYRLYERDAMYFIPLQAKPINYPVNVKCLFYVPTKRKCDLTNMLEAIDDIMVKRGLLADDNYTVIEAHDGSRVLYDKENPRTEVYITPIQEEAPKETEAEKCDKKLIQALMNVDTCVICGADVSDLSTWVCQRCRIKITGCKND